MKVSKGLVTEIQRWSLNDGSGIRTTVFLKGCPLRCEWCHNPETHSMNPELTYNRKACRMCGDCAETCPENALKLSPGGIVVDRNLCTACGLCAKKCESKALSISGRVMTTDAVMHIIEKDSIFFRYSGGGVTFSGGEPTMQKDFLESMIDECVSLGIDTAIETSMHFDWEQTKTVLEKTDMFFADIKHMDAKEHERWTGAGNETVLENLKRLSILGKNIVVRIPLVSGLNDTEKNIISTAEFIRDSLSVKGVELLPYHKLGKDKYTLLGKKTNDSLKRPSKEKIAEIEKIFEGHGIEIMRFG